MKPEHVLLEAIQDLFQKGGFEGSILAWVNSINDTMDIEDCAADLKAAADTYGRKNALFQIASLMRMYDISGQDISKYLAELKATGWPEYS
jgi:hypothetical protein